MDTREVNSIAWRDMLFSALLGVTCLFVVVLASIITRAEQEAKTTPPGNLIVTIVWPAGDDDVDLWVLCPGDPHAVGYSAMSGHTCNLLRDDLGDMSDDLRLNYENAYSRGVPGGDYIVNVHAYRCHDFPIDVTVEVAMNDGGATRTLMSVHAILRRPGEELTAVRFRLDANGNIVPGSLNHLFRPLRAGSAGP